MPGPTRDWRDEIEDSFVRGRHEQRTRSRTICHIPARFWIEGDDAQRHAVVRNFSEVGAFLETDPLPAGTRLRLKLDQPGYETDRAAEVVWLEDPGPSTRVRTVRGVGIRFLAVVSAASP